MVVEEESQSSCEGVKLFSVAVGLENSLMMLKSSLLRLVLASMRLVRVLFFNSFRSW